MKKILFIFITGLVTLSACDDMNSINQEWLDRGETIYTGAVDSLKSRIGLNRVLLKWQMNADPRIKDLIILWNNKKDSLLLPIVRNTPEKKGIYKDSIIVDKNLEEGTAVFQFYTKDDQGHTSIISELTTEILGKNFVYSTSLRVPRKILNMELIGKNSVTLKFEKVQINDLNNTILKYLSYKDSQQGKLESIIIPNDVNDITLENIKPEDPIIYQSTFSPAEDALDVFKGKERTINIPEYFVQYDRSDWKVLEVSDETARDGGGKNTLIDGNLGSYWHSKWDGGSAPLPHWAIIDMNKDLEIKKFDIYRRKGNGDAKSVEMYISDQSDVNGNWTKVANGMFTSGDKLEIKVSKDLKAKGRYIKIVLPDSNRNPFTSIAEVYAYGGL